MPRSCLLLLVLIFSRAELVLRSFSNSALVQPPVAASPIATLSDVAVPAYPSHELLGTWDPLSASLSSSFDFNCTFSGFRQLFLWVDDHLILQHGVYNNSANGVTDTTNFTVRHRTLLTVRAHLYPAQGQSAELSCLWCPPSSACASIPASTFTPAISAQEEQRRVHQSAALARWGSWLHRDILSIVLLPDSAVLTFQLCDLIARVCLAATPIDGNGGQLTPRVRVGAHSLTHSYSQAYVAFLLLNISIEYTVSADGQQLDAVVTPQTQATFRPQDYAVVMAGRFAWGRTGQWSNSTVGLSFSGTGLRTVSLYASHASLANATLPVIFPPGLPGGIPCSNDRDCSSEICSHSFCAEAAPLVYFAMSLGNGSVGVTTAQGDSSIQSIAARVEEGRVAEYAKYAAFGVALQGVVEAVTAAVGWRNIFVPCEVGSVMPVSFGFSWISPNPRSADFSYTLFCWDNLFASVTASIVGGKDAAISNLIQITKATSNRGYVPNWSSGGSKAQQSEPAVGGFALLELWKRYQELWLVELLFDDLLNWNDWNWNSRRVVVNSSSEPGFISVGNDYFVCDANTTAQLADCVNVFKGESGLDQSPLWDCPGAQPDGSGGDCTGMAVKGLSVLTVAEVQSTSMFVLDALSLATLAGALNRTEDQRVLLQRAASMTEQLKLTWNESSNAFLNYNLFGGNSATHISPTIFYPLLAAAATPEQVVAMIQRHLLNQSVLCVALDFKDNPEDCYWGLPSIARNDPAFMQPLAYVYWRGLAWAPMTYLTFLSLDAYRGKHPVIDAAITALATQKAAQLMDMWNRNRHVCENYSPFASNSTLPPGTQDGLPKSNSECTGWELYTWGALNGLPAILNAQRRRE
jgi:hypothetical protein